jgi:hypothetical protein
LYNNTGLQKIDVHNSTRSSCANPEFPAVYGRVAAFGSWIAATTRNGPHPDGGQLAWSVLAAYSEAGPGAGLPPAPADPAAFVAQVQARPTVEHRNATVARLYHAVLGRAPDPWGDAWWVGRMAAGGVGATRVAEVMARSAEFRATYGALDDTAFVAQVFANVLGRAGAPSDLAHFADRLAAGESRGRIVALVAESPENRARTRATVDVEVAFLALLGRPPAAHELATWAGRPVAELARFVIHSHAYAATWAGFGVEPG